MHFNYYTLKHLRNYLTNLHRGDEIVEIFSQNRQELVIEFERGFLRVGCHTPLTFMVPVSEYARARKNTVSLFPELTGRRVEGFRVLPFERVLILELAGSYDLVCKMHGIGSNVLLRKEGVVEKLFINRHEMDWQFLESEGPFDEAAIQPDTEPDSEQACLKALRTIAPVYEKEFARRIWGDMQAGKSFTDCYRALIAEVESPTFFVRRDPTRMKFMLFRSDGDKPAAKVAGIFAALNLFLRTHYQYSHYASQYKTAQKELGKPVQKFRKVFEGYRKNIQQLETDRSPEEIGHLIMANLHALETGMKSAELDDFFTGSSIRIKLRPELSPQENAARYYEKAKQRKGKLSHLKVQLVEVEAKLLRAESELERLAELPDPEALAFGNEGFDPVQLKAVRQATRQLNQEQQAANTAKYPFRSYEREGYQIFVGKNARNSDELSFKFANRQDLWLHAKDVTGSHVIVRHRAGQNVPLSVLEYAAGLAAWFSKRKNDALVPVQYTPRKYIRKRKGDPPGKVAVDREEVILVEPVKP